MALALGVTASSSVPTCHGSGSRHPLCNTPDLLQPQAAFGPCPLVAILATPMMADVRGNQLEHPDEGMQRAVDTHCGELLGWPTVSLVMSLRDMGAL